MNAQIPNRVVLALTFALVFAIHQNSFSATRGAGIALIKEREGQSEEFWKPLSFSSSEPYAVAIKFTPVGKHEAVSIPTNLVGAVVELPDFKTGNFYTATNFAAVTAKRQELEQLAKRCKDAAPTLLATAKELKQAEDMFAAGNVIRSGRWINAEEWKRLQAVENPVLKTVPSLTVNGQTFKDARLTSFRGATVGIIHAGGIGTLQVSALSDEQIAQLNATSPSLKIDKSMLPPTTVAAAQPTANTGQAVITDERMAKAKADLAGVEAKIEVERKRWQESLNTINRLTNNKKTPVQQGSQAYGLCSAASQVMEEVEKGAPKLTAEQARLNKDIHALASGETPKQSSKVVAAAPSKSNKNDANDYYRRGNDYAANGHFDKAIADYDEAIRLDPKNSFAYQNRGSTYALMSEFNKAIASYDEAIRLSPYSSDAYYSRGNAHFKNGEQGKAVADFRDAIRVGFGNASAVKARKELKSLGETDEPFTSEDPHYYFNRGDVHLQNGEVEKAIVDFSKAIRLDPNYVLAYHKRADANFKKREYEKAIADYDEAIRIDPKDALAFHNRGFFYYFKRDWDKSIADYDEAIRLDPKYALAYHNRGMAHERNLSKDKAIADLREAVRLDPNNADAREHLKSLIKQ